MFFKLFLAASSNRSYNQLPIIPREAEEWSVDAHDTQPQDLVHLVLINGCVASESRCS